jgi:hypothetical protein
MIIIESDKIQQRPNQTSKYTGVSWHRDKKKWQTKLTHNNTIYCGGYFDNEEQAAMKINLLCDKNGIKRKNLMIKTEPDIIQQVNKEIKVEDANILHGFKYECENRFMENNDEESCITTPSLETKKRKRQEKPITKDFVKEKVEITAPNHNGNELSEKIQKY